MVALEPRRLSPRGFCLLTRALDPRSSLPTVVQRHRATLSRENARIGVFAEKSAAGMNGLNPSFSRAFQQTGNRETTLGRTAQLGCGSLPAACSTCRQRRSSSAWTATDARYGRMASGGGDCANCQLHSFGVVLSIVLQVNAGKRSLWAAPYPHAARCNFCLESFASKLMRPGEIDVDEG